MRDNCKLVESVGVVEFKGPSASLFMLCLSRTSVPSGSMPAFIQFFTNPNTMLSRVVSFVAGKGGREFILNFF